MDGGRAAPTRPIVGAANGQKRSRGMSREPGRSVLTFPMLVRGAIAPERSPICPFRPNDAVIAPAAAACFPTASKQVLARCYGLGTWIRNCRCQGRLNMEPPSTDSARSDDTLTAYEFATEEIRIATLKLGRAL